MQSKFYVLLPRVTENQDKAGIVLLLAVAVYVTDEAPVHLDLLARGSFISHCPLLRDVDDRRSELLDVVLENAQVAFVASLLKLGEKAGAVVVPGPELALQPGLVIIQQGTFVSPFCRMLLKTVFQVLGDCVP